MTSVIIWHNCERQTQSVWAVADSRISQPLDRNASLSLTDSAQKLPLTLTDEAPKLLELRLEVRRPGAQGFFSDICHAQSFGLAYAGNTLVANSVYAAIAPLFRSLSSPTGEVPSLFAIAEWIAKFVDRYTRSRNRAANPRDPILAEFAIFGTCPLKNVLEVVHIAPAITDSGFHVELHPFLAAELDSILLLGDEKVEVGRAVSEARSEHVEGTVPWWRAPRRVLGRLISEAALPTIGGTLQMAIATPMSYSLYRPVEPVVFGQPRATMRYLGLEMDELEVLGPCYVGLPGMA